MTLNVGDMERLCDSIQAGCYFGINQAYGTCKEGERPDSATLYSFIVEALLNQLVTDFAVDQCE